jgi:hypothetical protein
VLERRSQRHADDSGTILEKAQEAKRKWNEEDPKDKTKQQPMHINSVDLVSTSSAIGLTSKDRNPVEDKVIRKIVIEEEQKYEAAIKNCTADSYNPPVDTEGVAESNRGQGIASDTSRCNIDISQIQEDKIDMVAGRGRRNTRNRNKKMIGLIWNIRGMGSIGRIPALVSRIRDNHVDFVGVI